MRTVLDPEFGHLVGRRDESAQLEAALQLARGGRRQLVLLSGPAGAGKSRLASELERTATRAGDLVVWGRCPESPGTPPFWPWTQALRSLSRQIPGDPAGDGPGIGLDDLLDQMAPAETSPSSGQTVSDAEQARFRLLDGVTRALQRAPDGRMLVLILDDVHWADPSSLRLLAFVADGLDQARVALVVTYREDALAVEPALRDTVAELLRLQRVRQIRLPPFTQDEVREYLRRYLDQRAVTEELVRLVHERTEGLPFFVVETARFLQEHDVGHLADIPPGIRTMIGKRAGTLSHGARQVLTTAACMGRRFSPALLIRLSPDRSDDEVLQSLEEARAAGLIETGPDTEWLHFGHALIRETLYAEMLPLRRARLHLRIAELLDADAPAQPPASLWPALAYHYAEAASVGGAARALDCASRAGDTAAQAHAHEEAARCFRAALAMADRAEQTDPLVRCTLLLRLGRALTEHGAGESGAEVWQDAAALADQLDQPALLARAALGLAISMKLQGLASTQVIRWLDRALASDALDDDLRVELLCQLCRARIYLDQRVAADEAHHQALALAPERGPARRRYFARMCLCTAVYWPEDLERRLSLGAQAQALALANDEIPRTALVELLCYRVIDLMRCGAREALADAQQLGLALARQGRLVLYEGLLTGNRAITALNDGRLQDAEAWAAQAMGISRKASDTQATTAYGMHMFCIRREQGRLHEALPLLRLLVGPDGAAPSTQAALWRPGLMLLYAELGMTEACRTEYERLLPLACAPTAGDASALCRLLFTAEACVALDDAPGAALLRERLQPHAGSALVVDAGGGPCAGSADRLRGMLATVCGDFGQAQHCFDAALAFETACGWRTWQAHTRFRLAWMWQQRATQGDADAARQLAGRVRTEATALGLEALAARCQTLLTRLDATRPRHPCGLTDREVEVLRLIAIGRNNREVAQVLSISPNTVANHMRSILEKTYCANRTEAAAFAAREGLLKG
ncbi:AAA family ATPase [uncultured Sphaerotilus sp.]|uniref:helix-turn-helix transcriptional regulator n=1 Tax=uncultured Sphaerotilus sp. TaxID=474984 RepID=UPI0030CA2AA9